MEVCELWTRTRRWTMITMYTTCINEFDIELYTTKSVCLALQYVFNILLNHNILYECAIDDKGWLWLWMHGKFIL